MPTDKTDFIRAITSSDSYLTPYPNITDSIKPICTDDLVISNDWTIDFSIPYTTITDVNILVWDKVVEVTFATGDKRKAVCHGEDTFDLERAIGICVAKQAIGGSKAYNDEVRRGLKVYEKKQIQAELDQLEKERIERKRLKSVAKKARRLERKKQEQIEEQIHIQTEALLRAKEAEIAINTDSYPSSGIEAGEIRTDEIVSNNLNWTKFKNGECCVYISEDSDLPSFLEEAKVYDSECVENLENMYREGNKLLAHVPLANGAKDVPCTVWTR